MADTARSAASERDVSLLQTPSVPITLANLGQYLAELKRMMPPTPMVQVGLCACPWRGRFLCVLRCVVVLPCRSRCAACVAVPLPLPALQVEFENITYTTKVPVREAHIPTVATALTGIASRPAMRTHAVLQVSDAHCCVSLWGSPPWPASLRRTHRPAVLYWCYGKAGVGVCRCRCRRRRVAI